MAQLAVSGQANQSTFGVISASKRGHRDIALDAIRGLCLIFMTVNHLPGNRMQRFTFQPFGFISDREIFVFLSGVVAAWLSGKVWQRRGTGAFLSRVLKGMARIYLVSMGVTFALLLVPNSAATSLPIGVRSFSKPMLAGKVSFSR